MLFIQMEAGAHGPSGLPVLRPVMAQRVTKLIRIGKNVYLNLSLMINECEFRPVFHFQLLVCN